MPGEATGDSLGNLGTGGRAAVVLLTCMCRPTISRWLPQRPLSKQPSVLLCLGADVDSPSPALHTVKQMLWAQLVHTEVL